MSGESSKDLLERSMATHIFSASASLVGISTGMVVICGLIAYEFL